MSQGRKRSGEERRVLVSVYLPTSLHARVKAVATSKGLSVTAFLEEAVRWWLSSMGLPVSKADQAVCEGKDGGAGSTKYQGVKL